MNIKIALNSENVTTNKEFTAFEKLKNKLILNNIFYFSFSLFAPPPALFPQ